MKVEYIKISELRPHPLNPRFHSEGQLAKLEKSIKAFGFVRPVLVTQDLMIIAGHGGIEAAIRRGMDTVPVIRSELSGASADAYLIADNRLGELSTWNDEFLSKILSNLNQADFDATLTGFDTEDIDRIVAGLKLDDEPSHGGDEGDFDAEEAAKNISEPITKLGDLWLLGRHRLVCGDCTIPGTRAQAFGRKTMELVLTDPPYCSGGFQEAQRGSGSIGTRANARIISDQLSTRGYMSLIRNALSGFPIIAAYVFTDWRMWSNLYDTVESCGYPVRSMVVWDKGSPGMGRGWRSQHELIMFAVKGKLALDTKAVGNVVRCSRTGNVHHPTQKPVEILETLCEVADLTEIYDPFSGSGSTLVACEQTGRNFCGVEIDPVFCDVTVQRWEKLTGLQAEKA